MILFAMLTTTGCARCNQPVEGVVLLLSENENELEGVDAGADIGVDGKDFGRLIATCRPCMNHLIEAVPGATLFDLDEPGLH